MFFVGERLKQARLARGLTAKELAGRVEISPSVISGYENGSRRPSPETLDNLAGALEVPVRMLHKEMPENGNIVHDVFYRSVSSTTKSLRDKLDQHATWLCEIFDFVEANFVFSPANLPEIEPLGAISRQVIEDAALRTRKLWELGDDPVPNLMDLMETHGITISRFPFGSEKMDGFSFWHRDNYPMTVLASDKDSRSRTRFDLAHELGHLVLKHKRTPGTGPDEVKKQEADANMFASAFLLPEAPMREDLSQVLSTAGSKSALSNLWPLKIKWKASVAALLYRAKDLGEIGERQYKSAYVMLSQRGWRKNEPFEDELPSERPVVLKQCLETLVNDEDYTPNEILEKLSLPATDVINICGLKNNFFDFKKDVRIKLEKRNK